MTERQRPTAKDILEGVVQAMYDAQEPLDEDLALVPANYEVYLHPEAYQELRSLMPRIKAQVRKKLDYELDRLNRRRPGRHRFLARLRAFFTRLLYAERYVQRDARPTAHERSGEAWHVEFAVAAEPDAGVDYLVVESDFGMQRQTTYKGRPTVNIRRRTTKLPDGRFETVLTAERPRPTARPRRAERRRTGAAVPSTDVLARLIYEDNSGQHVYYMRKAQIVIGRQDDPASVLDVALQTRPDVSREHLWIRHDARSGAFAVKDLSQYGSTVNGRRLRPSLNEANEDVEVWQPLPRTAEIGLANLVFIQFEAL